MGNKEGFTWGPDNIPGRRIALKPGDRIAVYNKNGMPNISAKDLVTETAFVIPQTWKDEAKELVENLKKPKQKAEETIVFEANKQEGSKDLATVA